MKRLVLTAALIATSACAFAQVRGHAPVPKLGHNVFGKPVPQPTPCAMQPAQDGQHTTCVKVIDGSSFQVASGKVIHLDNVAYGRKDDVYGPQAKQLLQKLIEGKMIRCEKVSEGRDPINGKRLFAYVFDASTNAYVNGLMVYYGALRYTRENDAPVYDAYDTALRDASIAAQTDIRGGWATDWGSTEYRMKVESYFSTPTPGPNVF